MSSAISQQIRDFVIQTFLFGEATAAPPDDGSFIENGVIDSTGILELVAFVEQTFDVTVSDSEILPSNFDSVDRVVDFVTRKQASAQAA